MTDPYAPFPARPERAFPRDLPAAQAPDAERPEQSAEPAATPTYEELNALTVDELEDRLRAWNDEHPDQHLAIAGRKGEKIGRLLDAYEQEATVRAPAAPEQGAPSVAEQQLPTAPTATTPEGAPGAPVTVPGTVETGEASTGAQEPAQTADAAPGAGTATTEE